MKTVFSNHEVAHIWAKQSQQNGRNSANNIYFEGTKIYSYGSHFCMGKILGNGQVLLTNRSYSNTTAKHLNWTRQAVSHLDRVFCAYPDGSLTTNIKYFVGQFRAELYDIESPKKRQVTKDKAKLNLLYIADSVDKYLAAIGENLQSIPDSSEIEDFHYLYEFARNQDITKLTEIREQKRIEKEERQRIAAIEAKKKVKKDITKWRKGQNVYIRHIDEVYLRLTGEDVETSLGAKVSLKAAKTLFSMIKEGKDIKGFDIDGYTVIGLNGVLTIGCHKIERKEINRFAKSQNWGVIPNH